MDEGLAALYGAGIGAVFGGGTAIAAAWLGRAGMRMQADAAIAQAERQADAQLEQWKLTTRREATVAFLMTGHEFAAAARAHWLTDTDRRWGDVPRELLAEKEAAFDEAHRVLERTGVMLYLEAPPELAWEVKRIRDLAHGTHVVCRGHVDTDGPAAEVEAEFDALWDRIVEVDEAFARFADFARPHLMTLGTADWTEHPVRRR
ncbi:hypothetical protein PV342_12865 [Streptomyces sp. PA03-3a]|nr:hypothetical protein [Streptomyces sp. PA03-3a]